MSITFLGEEGVCNFNRETIRFVVLAADRHFCVRITKQALLQLARRVGASPAELLALFATYRPDIESIARSKFDNRKGPISDIMIELKDVEAYRAQAQ